MEEAAFSEKELVLLATHVDEIEMLLAIGECVPGAAGVNAAWLGQQITRPQKEALVRLARKGLVETYKVEGSVWIRATRKGNEFLTRQGRNK